MTRSNPWSERFICALNISTAIALLVTACSARHDDSAQDRLSLAREYIALTHRAQRYGLIHSKHYELIWGPYCQTPECRTALHRSSLNAATRVEEAQEDRVAQLLAAHLTSDDLLAAISFSKSKEGQSIRRAQDLMAGDVAKFDVEVTQQIREQFVSEFCPMHVEMCARAGLRPTSAMGKQHS